MGNTVGSYSAESGVNPVTTDPRHKRGEIAIPEIDTPPLSHAGLSQFDNKQLGMYLSGYTDGEGSFHVSIYQRTTLKIGWEARPSFSVCQKKGKTEVLELMLEYFHCGSIRNCVTDNVDHYEVRKIDDLLCKIIPHFEKYPLLSSRRNNIPLFKTICALIKEKHHLSSDGLKEILLLTQRMEVSMRRKHTIQEIVDQLERKKV
jgi:hypothetical protein